MALRVGLTGNIGSGKSTVARLLAERGAAVIDADALAREAVRDPAVLSAIAESVGLELVRGGELDREATARLIFSDPDARARLEEIIHPWVRERARRREEELLASSRPPTVIVHDVPLLFEGGLAPSFDAVVVVDAPLGQRIERVVRRSGIPELAVREREDAQMEPRRKAELADYVLDNAGDLEALQAQVEVLWDALTERAEAAPKGNRPV